MRKTNLYNFTKTRIFVQLITLLFLTSGIIFAQGNNKVFKRFNTADGLANNLIWEIFQDSQGYLWIGTHDGLNKFDGYTFTSYRNDSKDTNSISHNEIRSIYEDSNNDLWIGTKDGLNLYNRETDGFKQFRYSNRTEEYSNAILSIIEDKNGAFWFGTLFNGLTKFDRKTQKFEHFLIDSTENPGGNANAVWTIIEDAEQKAQKLWIGSYSSGLCLFDIAKETFIKKYKHDPKNPSSLSNDVVLTLLQNNNREIWLGSRGGGLSKFDIIKEEFTHYLHDPQDTNSLSNNTVYSIFQDPEQKDILWIGTADGLNELNTKTNKFSVHKSEFGSQESLSNNTIAKIYMDNSGVIWLGTADGLNKYDPGRPPFRHYNNVPGEKGGLNDNQVMSIFQSKKDSSILWIATFGGGLNRFDRSRNTYKYYKHNPSDKNSISSDIVRYLYEDPDEAGDILWVGTARGLNRFDINKNIFKTYINDPNDQNTISNDYIYHINETRDGMLWITTSAGLKKFDRKKEKFTRYIFEDTTYIPMVQKFLVNLTDKRKPVASILQVKDNEELNQSFQLIKKTNILALSLGEGTPQTERLDDYGWMTGADGKEIWEMKLKNSKHAGGHEKNRLQIWTSVLDPGSFKIHYKSDYSHSYGSWNRPMPKYPNMWGIQIFELSDTEYKLITENINNTEKPNSIVGSLLTISFEDSYGMLWIGTSNDGLSKLDRKTGQFTNYVMDTEKPNSISDNYILSIHEDKSGKIWIATNNGLNKYDRQTNSFIHYFVKDGLPINALTSIEEDINENLWLSSDNGITKFDPINKSNLDQLTFINYNIQDGLQYNYYYVGSSHSTSEGEIFFGGNNGFVSFFPGKINQIAPKILITDFMIFNKSVRQGKDSPLKKSISETENITLSHSQNVFSFEFVALHYSQPEKNKYLYKMEGFDQEWIDGKRRFVAYSNLDPGDYTFNVKASNSDGVWTKDVTSLNITILPPWWLTTWAYIGYGLLLVGGIFSVDRFQRRRLLAKAKEKMLIQDAEHRAETAELQAKAAESQAKVIEIENARKTQELEDARKLQLSMLPKDIPQLPNLDIAVYMQTATEVGGDYYDFSINDDGSLNVCLGDATGHGLKAGIIVSMMKSMFTSISNQKNIDEFLSISNNGIKNSKLDKMMIAFAMLNININKIRVANAGIPPIYIYRKNDNIVEEIKVNGMPLGAMKNSRYEIYESEITAGDTILMLSDGFPELQNENNEQYGYERLLQLFSEIGGLNSEQIVDKLKNVGSEWVKDKDPDDDVTFVVIKVK